MIGSDNTDTNVHFLLLQNICNAHKGTGKLSILCFSKKDVVVDNSSNDKNKQESSF